MHVQNVIHPSIGTLKVHEAVCHLNINIIERPNLNHQGVNKDCCRFILMNIVVVCPLNFMFEHACAGITRKLKLLHIFCCFPQDLISNTVNSKRTIHLLFCICIYNSSIQIIDLFHLNPLLEMFLLKYAYLI